MIRKIPAAVTILIAMVLGIIVGYMIFVGYPDKKIASQIAGYISIISDVFLRLIKMIIAPLVFSTLVVGIAHMGDAGSVGRVFAKAIGWFITHPWYRWCSASSWPTGCSPATTWGCRCPTSAPRPTSPPPSSRSRIS
jgi:hypothetical protein